MNVYDSCRQALKKEYEKDVTQNELGKRAGISQAHINRLLNGDSSFANLKFETLLKLLPCIRITLDGSPVHGHFQNVNGNGNIVAGRDAHAASKCAIAALYNGSKIKGQALTRRIKRLFKMARITGEPQQYCAHCLRTTFASICAENNVPLAVIQSWLGHTSQEVTRIYARIEDMRAKKKALERFPVL